MPDAGPSTGSRGLYTGLCGTAAWRGQSEHAPLIAAPSSLERLNMLFIAAAICGLKQCDGWSSISQERPTGLPPLNLP